MKTISGVRDRYLTLMMAAASLGAAACIGGGSENPAGTGGRGAGSGGAVGTGGSGPGSGGATGTGGAVTAGSGGATGSGGAAAGSGGTAGPGTGGVPGMPGTGGRSGSGGAGAGTGGVSATGGRSGSGGTNAGTGGASGVRPFLTEDFESGTAGMPLAGWDNFIAWVKNGTNPQGDTLALVDGTRGHAGSSKSIHFHGGANPAMITRPLPAGTNKLYVRVWVYMSRKLGMNPGANHETLIGIRKTSGSASDEVRFGEIKGVIGTNEVPTDNISPRMPEWGLGPVVPANQWACIEVAFIADQPQHVLYAWADGVMVHAITAGDQWQNGAMPANWMNGKFVEVILGWHSFSSANIDVWMDDLALGTDRIGCN
jgi:hypothetical protein